MNVQPAAFLRTTLPLEMDRLEDMDSGRYHSIWLPDHMVSFWPDSIWTPEFTDLATESRSPHRHLDAMAVAAAVAVKTRRALIATSVVDTVRRHPVMLAQSALTISHLSGGRFILGLGSGELENTVPYGFDFDKPVSRLEESIRVMKLLWSSEGPVDFEGQFYHLEHARLDTENYDGAPPPIWLGALGPRMLKITGRYGDGWWPAGVWTPEDYADKLATIRSAADEAGRDPAAIVPAMINFCLIGDDSELAEYIQAPLLKALLLQVPATALKALGFKHPMGEDWRGIADLDPGKLTREVIVDMLDRTDPEAILAVVPHGTPQKLAARYKEFADAGMRVPTILDYSGMAGLRYAERSRQRVRETEDALLRLTGAGV